MGTKLEGLKLVTLEAERVNDEPYRVAVGEMRELKNNMANIPGDAEGVIELMGESLRDEIRTLGWGKGKVGRVFGMVAPDVAEFAQMVREISEEEMERRIQYCHPRWREVVDYVSPAVHDALIWSRCVGVIPLRALRMMRDSPTVSIGASALMHTTDLLAALGMREIDVVDFDAQTAAKTPLYPGGSVWNVGRPKALVAVERMYERNPDGRYRWVSAMAVREKNPRISHPQVEFEALINSRTRFVLEGVDASWEKENLREWLEEKGWEKVLVPWPADVSWPFAGFEKRGSYGFNQGLSEKVRRRMAGGPREKLAVMRDVYLMVKDNFGSDHRVQFALAAKGILPFWAQHPIAARESAALVSRGVIWENLGSSWAGKNIHPDTVPTRTLGFEYDQETQKLIEDLMPVVLKI